MSNTKESVESKEKTKKKEKESVSEWLRSLAVTFIIVVLVFTYIGRTAKVFGSSMTDTLQDNDFLILRSIFYTPQRGDIIAANCKGLDEVIVKRIIAVGGQEVYIDFNNGNVYVDGELLDEPYIKNSTINDEGAFNYPIVVDEGCYFCMGDNRQGSRDSRDPYVKFISREDILGKVIMRVFPLNKIKFFK